MVLHSHRRVPPGAWPPRGHHDAGLPVAGVQMGCRVKATHLQHCTLGRLALLLACGSDIRPSLWSKIHWGICSGNFSAVFRPTPGLHHSMPSLWYLWYLLVNLSHNIFWRIGGFFSTCC
jgi:hypothetical protein